MKVPKRIFFLLPSLNGGGAERVVLTLLRYLDPESFSPTLILLKKEGRYLDQVPPHVHLKELQISQVRYAPFALYRLIRREKPDIVFTTLAHLNLILALVIPFVRTKTRFIARESNTVSVRNKDENYPALFDWLYRHVYKNYDQIITQAQYMRDDLQQNYNIPPDKMHVIYNPVDVDTVQKEAARQKPDLPEGYTHLLACGRLDYEKGFDLLLESFALLPKGFYLTILGEGSHENALKEQAKNLGISQRVNFAGFVSNPYAYMQHCDLFVLSSRYEGLPNVVLEANACGTPVVAYASPGGTAEIITDAQNGFLVAPFDTEAFAKTIEKAIAYDFDPSRIRQKIAREFHPDRIISHYRTLFLSS